MKNYQIYIVLIFILFLMNFCTAKVLNVSGNSNVGNLYGDLDKRNVENKNLAYEVDFDGDGIFNANDKCISEPETYNFFMDNDGCPDDFIYSDDPLEIKYVKIFENERNVLTDNIKSLVQIKFLDVLVNYPNTFWILEIRSSKNSEKKANSLKEMIDKIVNTKNRIRTMNITAEYDEVRLIIDSEMARKINEKK